MARKTKEVTVTDVPADNRDKGKRYLLTEMPTTQAAKWAMRGFLALTNSGVEVPDEVRSMGMAGIAAFGFRAIAGLKFPEVELLMDELMDCVTARSNPADLTMATPLIEADIEEVSTHFWLLGEVFELHVGFSIADGLSMLKVEIALALSQNTPTSTAASA